MSMVQALFETKPELLDGAIPIGYRQTELGIFPKEWEVKQCSRVSALITVGIVIRPTQYYVAQGVPAFRSANIRAGGLDSSHFVFISPEANALLSKSQVRAGDVLTVRTGYPGTSAVVPPAFSGCNCIDVLITRPSSSLDPDFLAAWINSSFGKDQVLRNQGGLAQKHFNVAQMRNLLVACPPLDEQRAIAAALLDVDRLIGALDKVIVKNRAIKLATMQQLLTGKTRLPGFSTGWRYAKLGQLGTTYGGLTGKTEADFGSGDALYIPFLNIMNNVVIEASYLAPVRVSETEGQHEVKKGDLFFNGSSETPEEVGMCAVLLNDLRRVYLNSFCFGFRLNEGSRENGLYLAYFFRSDEGRQLLYSLAQGATRYNLSKTSLLKLAFKIPSPEEQTAITRVLSDIDLEIAASEHRRDKITAIKQGMTQALLTGRIRLLSPKVNT
ncbi:MAG: restriction endonuclease subunit S [Acidobacteria bacterium]|nr:restriction endonuclease subunit S [Acidobacteriota bacterium]